MSDSTMLTLLQIAKATGDNKEYAKALRNASRGALASANRSNDPKRKAAAMRAINRAAKRAYQVGV